MSSSLACNKRSIALRRALVPSPAVKRLPTQTRSLWWWGRHSTFSSSNTAEEDIHTRLQRHQRVLRHRYSRALRRRAQWDRDNSPQLWSWRGPGRWLDRSTSWACKPISTTESLKARVKEEESGIPKNDGPWGDWNQDFERFKEEIDRAIKKDPYAVLFGRRGQVRGTSNNQESSRTSLSGIWNSFDALQRNMADARKASTNSKKIVIENLDGKVSDKSTSDAPAPTSVMPATSAEASPHKPQRPESSTGQRPMHESAANATVSQALNTDARSGPPKAGDSGAEEYIYDPISGRKVPKSRTETSVAVHEVSRKRPFLETLFAEHDSEPAPQRPRVTSAKEVPASKAVKISENSRAQEYQRLRAARLGNSIDTTAEFGGKYEPQPEHENIVTKERVRTSPEPDENAPLFSGTTYETKETTLNDNASAGVSWLQKEGFQQLSTSDLPPKDMPSNRTQRPLQPALDRVLEKPQTMEKKFVSKLQPAADRIINMEPREVKVHKPAPLNVTMTKTSPKLPQIEQDLQVDRREDLDLLRASDVRAATKTARVTTQELEQAKRESRSKLEADFANRQRQSDQVEHSSPRPGPSVMDTNIDRVRDHIKEFPAGVVAKTMRSMGMFNDNFRLYQRPGKPELIQKLEFKDEALEKLPSIFSGGKTKPYLAAQIAKVSEEADKVYKAKADMTLMLKNATEATAEQNRRADSQAKGLAKIAREVFEAHVGPIDVTNHTKVEPNGPSVSGSVVEPKTSINTSPLATATVKPGVPVYPAIERHTKEFEPKLIELRERLKANHKDLSSALLDVQSLKSAQASHIDESVVDQPKQPQTLPASQTYAETKNQILEQSDIRTSEVQQREAMRQLNEKLKRQMTQKSTLLESEPATVSNPPAQVGSDQLDSPYIILTYNKTTGNVNLTQLTELMGTHKQMEKMNPIAVMGKLNYPAAFVARFVEMEKAGYEISTGGGDMLILQKQNTKAEVKDIRTEALEYVQALKSDISELKNKIATEETANQPPTKIHGAALKGKQAATVLDQIPIEAPYPGPEAPIASTPESVGHKKKTKKDRKVRRQEQVFSGTMRPSDSSSASGNSKFPTSSDRPGLFRRMVRAVKRVILTTIALGSTAYVIGVVAEGIGAQAQKERGLTEGGDLGPRKKVVMPVGTRPGIFSTESTRD